MMPSLNSDQSDQNAAQRLPVGYANFISQDDAAKSAALVCGLNVLS
jgi:hypothetical protein